MTRTIQSRNIVSRGSYYPTLIRWRFKEILCLKLCCNFYINKKNYIRMVSSNYLHYKEGSKKIITFVNLNIIVLVWGLKHWQLQVTASPNQSLKINSQVLSLFKGWNPTMRIKERLANSKSLLLLVKHQKLIKSRHPLQKGQDLEWVSNSNLSTPSHRLS